MPAQPSEPPRERLAFFRQELGISSDSLAPLLPYAEKLAARAEDMAQDLYDAMGKMAQTKIVLDHETSARRLQDNWRAWYETLWTSPCDDVLLASLWHSGLRHVSHGVDHRFITLAYSQVRRFSHESIRELVLPEDLAEAHMLADRLFDLCILVESDAYIAAQAHCSNDVMMGIAHQLRNPLTVIGGMAHRLLKANGESPAMSASLEAVLGEANRMERMMRDLVTYIEMLRKEPAFARVSLYDSLHEALEKLQARDESQWDITMPPQEFDLEIQADPDMLATLLLHILENAREAQEGDKPSLLLRRVGKITGKQTGNTAGRKESPFVTLEICNPGALPLSGSLEDLFQPFHSTRPHGTGLGLAIARLAAHKNFGTVRLQPWQKGGLCCRVTLVKAGYVHDSGLFFTTKEKQGEE